MVPLNWAVPWASSEAVPNVELPSFVPNETLGGRRFMSDIWLTILSSNGGLSSGVPPAARCHRNDPFWEPLDAIDEKLPLYWP